MKGEREGVSEREWLPMKREEEYFEVRDNDAMGPFYTADEMKIDKIFPFLFNKGTML